jgi:hypothetical protein
MVAHRSPRLVVAALSIEAAGLDKPAVALLLVAALLAPIALLAAQTPLAIDRARWDRTELRLRIWGSAMPGSTVSLTDSITGELLDEVDVNDDGRWVLVLSDPSPVPCAVAASTADESVAAQVSAAPASCGRVGANPPTLVSLAVSGPLAVPEGGLATYVALATFSDGSKQDVTRVATWKFDSPWATVDGGGLRAQLIGTDEVAKIEASLSLQGVTAVGNLAVTILDRDGPPRVDSP